VGEGAGRKGRVMVSINYEQYIGGTYFAADGGGYGIYIVGILPDVSDFVVMDVRQGKIDYTAQPRRLGCYKASYRYVLE
jgi:hypothetical protein